MDNSLLVFIIIIFIVIIYYNGKLSYKYDAPTEKYFQGRPQEQNVASEYIKQDQGHSIHRGDNMGEADLAFTAYQ